MLNGYVHSTTRYLKEVRVRPGARGAIFSKNSVEYVIALLALWRAGACVMPLGISLPASVLDDAVRNFQPDFLFFSGPMTFKTSGLKTFPLETMVSYQYTDGFLGREDRLAPMVDSEMDAAVVLTSGSSGAPKGALLSYGNLYHNAVGANEIIPYGPDDRWLLSLPLWHVSGLSIIFRALVGGGAIAIPAADVSLVPAQLKRLMGSKDPTKLFSSMKAILLGGAPVPPLLARNAVKAGAPLFATYGLTETASQVATGRVDKNGAADTCPLKDREVAISPAGEILLRGPVVFRRYLFGGGEDVFDRDGWFHTGDTGEIDKDGRLRITGRRDDMFVSGGENIYPETIEKALLGHPAVEQVLVVAVEDGDFGRRPAAFVRFRGSTVAGPDELTEFLKGRVARYELPKSYFFWPEMAEGLKPERKSFMELAARSEAKPLGRPV
jgi:O-succinylbenzoic acid--CoA ligase